MFVYREFPYRPSPAFFDDEEDHTARKAQYSSVGRTTRAAAALPSGCVGASRKVEPYLISAAPAKEDAANFAT